MAKKRPGTEPLRTINDAVKEAAEVIQENIAGRAAGRPPKYHIGFAHIAGNTALIGSSNKQLADMFGVDVATIDKWIVAYEHFSGAIKRGREVTDDQVEASLLHRARGYSHPEEKIFCHEGAIVRATTTAQYPPDATSAIFWLANRRPDRWKRGDANPIAAPEDAARILREQMIAMDAATDPDSKK